jgi:predicted nuclease with TOPRIM domain
MNAKGYVYIVQTGKNGPVKIGCASCGISKGVLFNQIEAESEYRITRSVIFPETENPAAKTAILQHKLKSCRTSGKVNFDMAVRMLEELLVNEKEEKKEEMTAVGFLKAKLGEKEMQIIDLREQIRVISDTNLMLEDINAALRQEITELKAKLYDLMDGGAEKEG